jgi:hypothetical protein
LDVILLWCSSSKIVSGDRFFFIQDGCCRFWLADISRHFFIVVGTVDMSVGLASIIGGYATIVTSGRFSDNKQWNSVQKGIGSWFHNWWETRWHLWIKV